MRHPSRREFLQETAAASGGLALAAPLEALARAGRLDPEGGYGPLETRPDENTGASPLALPRGFRYWSIGAVGSIMSDGRPTPSAHDGTAAFASGSRVRLVRNHEQLGVGPAFGPLELAYDPQAPGGTTTLVFDPAHPERPESFASLSGTSTNCAGGLTPWGSWLTCEETFHEARSAGRLRRHGYVFEVPSAATSAVPATPLRALGRFVHEAVVVDPQTGILYETEDADTAGFFRFVPESGLAAGRLQMLTLPERRNADTRRRQTVGRELKVDWVEVDEPDPDEGQPSCHHQGFQKGAAVFRRLEGAWWSPIDRAVYFTATDGGDAEAGQVWAYRPAPAEGTLTLVYESPSSSALFKPDNITVSPQGGLLLCEDPDGSGPCRLRGLSRDGRIYPFAEDVRTDPKSGERSRDEFTGACFSPDGSWLFVNLQGLGVTFAITGPFAEGPLGPG